MNRKLLNGLLVLTVAAGGVGTFTSCKDENFQDQVNLETASLQAQIDAIRGVTDAQFKENMETWLNNLTAQYSDYNFQSYEDAVAALDNLERIYQSIMNDDPWGEGAYATEFVKKLWEWLIENKLDGNDWVDWFELIEQVASRATSVEVNQTYNPMFGSLNLPIGLKTTALTTYVVETVKPFDFPTAVSDDNIAEESPYHFGMNDQILATIQTLAPETVYVENGQYTYTEEGYTYGNLGAVYATINPTNVDFSNADNYAMALVDSKGEELTGVTVKASVNTDLLSFGYTRAGEANGVYKLAVDAEKDVFDGKVINLEDEAHGLKENVKAFIDNKSITNLAYIGEQLYKSISDELYAYGVKVTVDENVYDQESGDVTGSEKVSTLSSLDLAVAAVHPLSYGEPLNAAFDQTGLSKYQLPVWSSLDEILNKIENKLTLKITPIGEVDDVEIMVSWKFDDGMVWAVVDGKEYGGFNYDPSGSIELTESQMTDLVSAIVGAYDLALSAEMNSKMIAAINESIASINSQLEKYNSKIGKFADYVREHKAYDYASKLYEYYAQVASRVNEFLKNPEHYLQVMAIYSDGAGHYHHLSTDYNAPTVVEPADSDDAIELLCSSYNGDVLTPSYLKYVAITQVGDQPATKAINEKAGEEVNKVFPGQNHRVAVKVGGLDKGTYTLTYMSVDYSGVCSVQNYYIYVNK